MVGQTLIVVSGGLSNGPFSKIYEEKSPTISLPESCITALRLTGSEADNNMKRRDLPAKASADQVPISKKRSLVSIACEPCRKGKVKVRDDLILVLCVK